MIKGLCKLNVAWEEQADGPEGAYCRVTLSLALILYVTLLGASFDSFTIRRRVYCLDAVGAISLVAAMAVFLDYPYQVLISLSLELTDISPLGCLKPSGSYLFQSRPYTVSSSNRERWSKQEQIMEL